MPKRTASYHQVFTAAIGRYVISIFSTHLHASKTSAVHTLKPLSNDKEYVPGYKIGSLSTQVQQTTPYVINIISCAQWNQLAVSFRIIALVVIKIFIRIGASETQARLYNTCYAERLPMNG
ncbi:hypothetical protein BPOR_0241g00130 [Botrytis porri]|uniref:Uncharacterized protein n=1 Tax=Botrytis porri TaxID=87229 RepID=A0A4Z1KP52_9HELO|nr:hypothetical protein BPOR_0241g00130 [Botrytis porri]